MSYEPFGTIVRLGSGQETWMTTVGVDTGAGDYVIREDLGNGGFVVQKITSGNLGTAVAISNQEEMDLYETGIGIEVGTFIEYYSLDASSANDDENTSYTGNFVFDTWPGTVYDTTGGLAALVSSHANTSNYMAFIEGADGLYEEGIIDINSTDRPVVYLNDDDLKKVDGDSTSLTSGYYAVIHSPTTSGISVQKVDKGGSEDSPTFSNAQTATALDNVAYTIVHDHIFGNHYVANLTGSTGNFSAASATIEKMHIGWDAMDGNSGDVVESGGFPEEVDIAVSIPLTLTNAGTASEVEGTATVTSYDPAGSDGNSTVYAFYYGPGASGDYFTFAANTTLATGESLTGDYVIVNNGTDHYTAYELTGNGDLDDPYVVDDVGIHLDLLNDVGYGNLTSAGSYDIDTLNNVYTFASASGDFEASSSYAFYEKFTNNASDGYYAIKVSWDADNSQYVVAEGATEISVGSEDAFGTLVATLDAVGNYSSNNGNANGNGSGQSYDPGSRDSGNDSLQMDIDTAVYSIAGSETGVSGDGLYVLKLNSDNTSYDAHLVTGNAQTGYTIAKTADKTSLYADATAVTNAGLSANGILETRIVNLVDGDNVDDDDSTAMVGDYALIENANGKYDGYEVYTKSNGNFSIGDMVKENWAVDADAVDALSYKTVGYLDIEDSTYYVGGSDQAIFEIEAVDSGRYGNIITYGVKLVDGDYGESATLTSMQFNLSWTADGGDADYAYWGQFTPSGESPNSMTYSDAPDDGSFTPATFFTEVSDTGISFAMFDDAGMTYDAGEYVATFMLEKTNSLTTNDLTLTTAQYTLYNAYDTDANVTPEEQTETTNSFYFDPHDLTLKLKTANGQEVPNVEVMTTDLATNDGLSIIPVLKNGDIIQYQLVMNVPIPTFIQHEADSNVGINPNHKIVISGADIFDSSITWLTGLADMGSEAASLTQYVTSADRTVLLGQNDVSGDVGNASKDTYTGHEFFDLVLSTQDGRGDLSVSDSLTFELEGLQIPTVSGSALTAEGRYILAEFTAHVDSTIKFTASQKGDGNSDVYVDSTERTISRQLDSSGLSDSTDGWVQSAAIDDGSEVVALAEGWYLNERETNDAVGAEDALGALRVSRDGNNGSYSQSEIIAADFNLDGEVTAADAYDILQFAVAGPDDVSGTAKWVYIDDIDSNGATANNVHYDKVTDLFVGRDEEIDATAVLIGDVTSSFSGLGTKTSVADYADWLEFLAESSIIETAEVSTNNYSVTLTSSSDVILLGAETGIHVISGTLSGTDNFALSDSFIATWNSLDEADSATTVNYTSPGDALPDVTSDISDIFGTTNGSGETVHVAKITISDLNATNANADVYVIAWDLDDSGTFTADKDLMIQFEGVSTLPYESSPYSFENYQSEWAI